MWIIGFSIFAILIISGIAISTTIVIKKKRDTPTSVSLTSVTTTMTATLITTQTIGTTTVQTNATNQWGKLYINES